MVCLLERKTALAGLQGQISTFNEWGFYVFNVPCDLVVLDCLPFLFGKPTLQTYLLSFLWNCGLKILGV